jgi:hypothetical protein
MTAAVVAIHMFIAGVTTNMTMGDDICGDAFTQPLIENKIFSYEIIFQSMLTDLVDIVDNPSF